MRPPGSEAAPVPGRAGRRDRSGHYGHHHNAGSGLQHIAVFLEAVISTLSPSEAKSKVISAYTAGVLPLSQTTRIFEKHKDEWKAA